MRDSRRVEVEANRPDAFAAPRILDAGPNEIDGRECADIIRSILGGQAVEWARDRNSTCYRVRLAGRGAVPAAAIVKVPRPGPQRTNPDASFADEARVLAGLPAIGIINAPRLVARVQYGGNYFLITTELSGKHPDPTDHPLDGRQLEAILDGLGTMDRQGFMHYDLKSANILICDNRAAFLDFEFARFGDPCAAFAPTTAAFCEDFNVSGNPHFPARSNVANFEFRALHRYLLELRATQSAAAGDDLLRAWLRGKSLYHSRMADFYAELAATSLDAIAAAGRIAASDARDRLGAAAGYESLLAALFEHPCDAVARAERSLMAFRHAIFERDAETARLQQRATIAEIRRDASGGNLLPDAYRSAAVRTLRLVARSVHPPS